MPNKDISDSLFRTIVDIYKEKLSGVRPNYQDSSVPLDLNDYIFVHSGCVNPTYSEPHGKKIVSFYQELASKFPNEHRWLSLDELKYFLRVKGIPLDSIFRSREDPDYEFESESEEEEWNDYNNQLASKDDLFAVDIDNDFDGFLLGLCFFLDFNDLTLEDLNNILCEKHWFINNDEIWKKQLVIYLKFDDVVFYAKNKRRQSTVEDKPIKSDLKKDNNKQSKVNNTNKSQTLLEQVLAYDLNKENHTLVSRAIQIVNDHKLSDIDITENAFISAECEGSHGESYFVFIKLDKKDRMIATCECPFYEDGKSVSDPTKSIKCKHILALIYYVQENKEEIYEQIEKELSEAEEKYGYLLSGSNKPSRKIPEPYVEQEIEKWNSTPNPYSPQIEDLEKQKKSIIASRKKIVKYILPIAIPGGISLILLYIGILISILSHSFVGGLIIPGIILLVIALIFLPFLIKAGKHNKSCNQRFRSVNLQIIDLKKKSDEFEKEQKQEKAEYDARVEKQKEENARRKEEYEAAIRQQNSNRQIKPITSPTKHLKTNKKLSDFSICVHAVYKGYDVCCVTSKVTDGVLPMYQPGFTFFDALKGYDLKKIKQYAKDPIVLGYFTVGVFLSQFCAEDIIGISLRQKKDTIEFLKEKMEPEAFGQITDNYNLQKEVLNALFDHEYIELLKKTKLFDKYLNCLNIENLRDDAFDTPLVLSVMPEDKKEASKAATINFYIDLELMKMIDDYYSLFFHLSPSDKNHDFFNDIESDDGGKSLVCQLPYRFFKKEFAKSADLREDFFYKITEAEKEYVRESIENQCANDLEDYKDIYEYIDRLSQGDRLNLLKDKNHYYIMKMPLGIFESLRDSGDYDCSEIDFTSDCYDDDIYSDYQKDYFSSDYFLSGKKQTKKQTKLTKEELVEMIRSKLGKDPEELEKSNNGIKLLDYYYKRYGDTDHISDLRSLLFETPYLYFDYLNDETPWYSPNYVKEFDYNLKEKKPTPFWQPKKNLDSEYRKRCIEYFLDYKNNIDNDSDVEKEYKAMLDHMIANVVYARNGSIEEKDLSTLNKITGFEIAIDDIGTPKKQEKTSAKKEQPLKDGDIYVDYLYCDEDSRARVIKIIYRVAVNEKHKIQADIYDLRYEAAYAFSSDFDSFETYRFEDDPNILYDEIIDARTLGDIFAHLYNLEFDDFELDDLDKLSSEEYDQLYNQVYFKVN